MTADAAEIVRLAAAIADAVGNMEAFPDEPIGSDGEDGNASLNEWMANTWIADRWPDLLRRASEVAARAASALSDGEG